MNARVTTSYWLLFTLLLSGSTLGDELQVGVQFPAIRFQSTRVDGTISGLVPLSIDGRKKIVFVFASW